MAVTVVRPEQQQQGQGMNQMLSMVEALNSRKAERREAQRTDMLQFVNEQAAQRGGFHNLLMYEGGEEVLNQFMTEGLGYNDEKAKSMLEVLRTGGTPDELQFANNRELYLRGITSEEQPVPQQAQQVQQAQQGQQTSPQRPEHINAVRPGAGEEGGTREPLMLNMSQTAVPHMIPAEDAKDTLRVQLNRMGDREVNQYIEGYLNSNPQLRDYYEAELSRAGNQRTRDGLPAGKEVQKKALMDAIDKAQGGDEISTTRTRMMDAPVALSNWVSDRFKKMSNATDDVRVIQEINQENPELKEKFEAKLMAEQRAGRLNIQQPKAGQYQQIFNEVVKEIEKNNPSLAQDIASRLSGGEVAPSIEEGHEVFAAVESVIQEVAQQVQAGVNSPYWQDGKIQNHAITRDIVKRNKHVFPDGYDSNNMNKQQRDYYNGVLAEVKISEGFYTGNNQLVHDGLLDAFNTVGTPPPEEEYIRTHGQQQAARKQTENRAPAAMRKIPHVRSALDMRNLSDEDLLARRSWVDRMWAENPQLVAETLPSSLGTRSKLVENRYKEALTMGAVAQARLMESQAGAMEDASPEMLQGQVALDLMTKFIANPQLGEQMPEVYDLIGTIFTNLTEPIFGHGVNAEMVKNIWSFLGKAGVKSKFSTGAGQNSFVVNEDMQGLMGY